MEGGENVKEDARERVATTGHLDTPPTPTPPPTPSPRRSTSGRKWARGPNRDAGYHRSQISDLKSQIEKKQIADHRSQIVNRRSQITEYTPPRRAHERNIGFGN